MLCTSVTHQDTWVVMCMAPPLFMEPVTTIHHGMDHTIIQDRQPMVLVCIIIRGQDGAWAFTTVPAGFHSACMAAVVIGALRSIARPIIRLIAGACMEVVAPPTLMGMSIST